MGNESVQLVWFKRDLRISDHLPLARAALEGKCICLYVYETELIEAADFDAAHLDFINDSVAELRFNLRRRGGELLLRKGRLPGVIETLHKQLGIAKVWAHEETSNQISFQRDRRVRAWAKSNGIPFEEIPQFGVIRRLKNRDGWAAKWKQRMTSPLADPPIRIRLPRLPADFDAGELRNAGQFQVHSFQRTRLQAGGERHAVECLDSFLKERGVNYRSDMSSPVTAESGCSRLSAYLAYGNISMRTIQQRTTQRVSELKTMKQQGAKIEATWLKSLASYQSRLNVLP